MNPDGEPYSEGTRRRAEDALANFVFPVAISTAQVGHESLHTVVPTTQTVALYSDLALVLGIARLGEGKQAWDLMLEYFDRNTDWGLEYCEQERDENGDCPGATIKSTFPQALERMLNKNGYMIGG